MMSRTIGDKDAATSSAVPSVRRGALPRGCGGRLVLASDGLWDNVNPKVSDDVTDGATL